MRKADIPEDDVLRVCVDGQGHAWGPEHEWIDRHGRRWLSAGCTKCNTGTFSAADDPSQSVQAFLDLLALHEEHRDDYGSEPMQGPAPHPLLPAWFTERMMSDSWKFGLLMDTGVILDVETITALHQAADGSLWLDVQLGRDPAAEEVGGIKVVGAPTSRTTASINAAHVVAALELADT